MALYEVNTIKAIKFNNEDIFVLVKWENSIFSEKPRLRYPGTIKKLVTNDESMQWLVIWDDSWIELSQLNDSGDAWKRFYNTKVIPELTAIFAKETPIVLE